ncbi:unnamed protein product [Caretta caretta]
MLMTVPYRHYCRRDTVDYSQIRRVCRKVWTDNQSEQDSYQPAPGEPYMKPEVAISNPQLNAVTDFCYLDNILSNVTIAKELTSHIDKAGSSFDRLPGRVWQQYGIKLQTKLKGYKAVVL